ncbi:thiamine pyrophosphate-binding protein [Epidermidibacterium keratini]|uniref:Thiamine pyrophosphate-binding protein n=1 Tax=Epidermidibacterium keratini TaxID=1891644 RepID=A0A7L4YJ67_9ACTN|nr:thiamine pyrophosphate-binding protein [Epidermidibacterium keratini]QHB98962.1 thiamine pyrophosphate-binding protein [Epidermidibacterium keratini]
MNTAELVGRTLVDLGATHVFGVVGSGNFHVTSAMVEAGARFVAARHEGGAACMADGFARMSDQLGVLSVHQGCGLTNAMTGIAEAAKSRTPLLVLAAEVSEPRSNFYVDQPALAAAVGAESRRIDRPETAVETVIEAAATALHGRRTVVLNLPLQVQSEPAAVPASTPQLPPAPLPVTASESDVRALAEAIDRAERPVFVAGRGARSNTARDALLELADDCGALVATSAVAKGLFTGSEWSLDVSGGFASPLAAELISQADLIVGWGCALNMWTMRHGRLIADDATVVQVDDTLDAIGAHRELSFGVLGDVAATAEATRGALASRGAGYRSDELRDRIASEVRWRDVEYADTQTGDRIDPRTLSIAIDDLLPAERIITVDSGNFMGYPSMFCAVPDEFGFCFTQAFQSVGLGLASAIGAALARPDRLPVAALGDGGALMGASELETVRRLGLPMVVVVYDDAAYGAEVHHFGPQGADLQTVRFPDTDLAQVARGYGFEAAVIRRPEDLSPLRDWLAGPQDVPFLIDAKVTSEHGSWWLEEAFRGH